MKSKYIEEISTKKKKPKKKKNNKTNKIKKKAVKNIYYHTNHIPCHILSSEELLEQYNQVFQP